MKTETPFTCDASIGVVIPAYRVAGQIEQVLRGIPEFVHSIIVVEDASPDDTATRVEAFRDERVTLLRHATNQGVGGAMRTGFAEALRQELDIVVKMDGDNQMDPVELPRLLAPLLDDAADMTKGTRYQDPEALRQMPLIRIIGNAALTFMVKLASGYWQMFDPTNGYFAIKTAVLRRMNLARLPNRYFFESGFLVSLGAEGAVVQDVPIGARYGEEVSSLSITRTLFEFPPRLFWGMLRRLFWRYVVQDFSPISVFLMLGLPLIGWGVGFGIYAWWESSQSATPSTAGTVMLAAMPIIIGFQLVLQAIVVDIGNVPKTPLSPRLKPRARSTSE